MSLRASRPAESYNLIQTYFALGTAIHGASAHLDDGFRYCAGSLPHPICNFAADLDLDLWSTHRLRGLANRQSEFRVYHMPGDDPRSEHLLLRAGFRQCLNLVQMNASAQGERCSLSEAVTAEERLRLASFMTDQFFSDQSPAFRRVIAQATASSHLELLAASEDSQIIAGMMLCASERHLGVYNLCVHSSRRNRGWGGKLLRAAMAKARDAGKHVTLQCDANLVPWYQRFGFACSGVVNVYSLPKR